MSERWLSISGICDTLQTTPGHVHWLVKQGFIKHLPGRYGRTKQEARYLDPSTEFKAQLQLTETIYGRLWPAPKELTLTGLLTVQEVAAILGVTRKSAFNALTRAKVKPIKIGTARNKQSVGVNVYTVRDIRNMLWKRQGRTMGVSKQRGPFLLSELIEFFNRYQASEAEEVPTDTEFREDDILARKLERLVQMNDPKAMREFYAKTALAKEVVASLRIPPSL